jgi:hypothetical protein
MIYYYDDKGGFSTTPPRADWWEVRDGVVHLLRDPSPTEPLPQVEATTHVPGTVVGGGWILMVRGPDGRLLTYGRGTE